MARSRAKIRGMRASTDIKEYNYKKWTERCAFANGIGDCSRVVEAVTANRISHWLVITYNQRFWTRASYHCDNKKDAMDKFKLECGKIKERAHIIKNKKRRGFGL